VEVAFINKNRFESVKAVLMIMLGKNQYAMVMKGQNIYISGYWNIVLVKI